MLRREVGGIARLHPPPPLVELFGGRREFLQPHAAPRTLQFDRCPLAFVERMVQFGERIHEVGLLAERGVGPADVAESPENLHEFLVTELEGRRRQEQHAVERIGHRAIAGSQRLRRLGRLKLLRQLRIGVLEVMGFVHDEQWRSPLGLREDLAPERAIDIPQFVAYRGDALGDSLGAAAGAERHQLQGVGKDAEIELVQRPDDGLRNRIIDQLAFVVTEAAVVDLPPVVGRRSEKPLPQILAQIVETLAADHSDQLGEESVNHALDLDERAVSAARMAAQCLSDEREIDPLVHALPRHRAVAHEDEVGALLRRVVEKPEERDAILRLRVSEGVWRHQVRARGAIDRHRPTAFHVELAEGVEILPPLRYERRRRHDDHGSDRMAQRGACGDGKGDECLPHADFVGEDDARLPLEPAKQLIDFLALSDLIRRGQPVHDPCAEHEAIFRVTGGFHVPHSATVRLQNAAMSAGSDARLGRTRASRWCASSATNGR